MPGEISGILNVCITNPRSSPVGLQATMPEYMVPFIPVIQEDEEPFATSRDVRQKCSAWVLDLLTYDSTEKLVQVLEKAIVRPVLEKCQELLLKKAEAIRICHVSDYP